MKRSYNDICGLAHALELVGDRWALLLMRELFLGPKRFTDLRAGLPAASPNVLSQRLSELEEAGILRRRRLAPPAGSWVYELTDWGQELEPTVRDLGRWAARSPSFPECGHFSPDSMALCMRTNFDPDAAAGFEARFEVRVGDDHYRVAVADGELEVERGDAEDPDAVIEADPEAFIDVLLGNRKLTQAERSGDLRVEGDRKAVAGLAGLFRLPDPVILEPAS